MLNSVKITEMGTERKIDMLPPDKRGKLFQVGQLILYKSKYFIASYCVKYKRHSKIKNYWF